MRKTNIVTVSNEDLGGERLKIYVDTWGKKGRVSEKAPRMDPPVKKKIPI